MKQLLRHNKFLNAVLLSGGLASVGLIGGVGIQTLRIELVSFTPLLVALPAMNAMAGDYASLIAAHLGDPEIYAKRLKRLLISLAVSLPVSIVGVTSMSLFVARLQDYQITFEIAKQYLVLIGASLTGVLIITLASVFIINRILKNKRLNSDDLLIPITNSIAGIVVLVSFSIIAKQLL